MNKGTCKFYNGDHHNKCCLAGVEYRSVTTEPDQRLGVAFRKPCVNWTHPERKFSPLSDGQLEHWKKAGKCEKYTEPTSEEIKAHEAEMDAYLERFKMTIPLISRIKKEHDKSWRGVEVCPACGGKLHLQLNCFYSEYQGTNQKHIHGQCETKDCLQWSE